MAHREAHLRSWHRALPIRLRLTLWYTSLLGAIVTVVVVLAYAVHIATHYRDIDRILVGAATHPLMVMPRQQGSQPVPKTHIMLPPEVPPSLDLFARWYTGAGRLVAATANATGQPAPDPRAILVQGEPIAGAWVLDRLLPALVDDARAPPVPGAFATLRGVPGTGRTRVYVVAYPAAAPQATSPVGYLLIGTSLAPVDRAMTSYLVLILVIAAGGALAAAAGGWVLAEALLRPLALMTRTARAIALSRGFDRRLPAPTVQREDELGQLAVTFNEMLASLDGAYHAQQQFVSNAAHELRAPLTAIQGNLELLQRASAAPAADRAEALAQATQQAQRLGRLVTDLLVLARADAGMPLRAVPVELDRLVVAVLREQDLLSAASRDPRAPLQLEGLEPVTVLGDPDRLRQVLVILVDNARKYTPASGRVALALAQANGQAVVTVRDTGMGITPEELPHIFQRFYRTESARARDPDGTGLGLAIAHWIVTQHGGTITVQSTPGRGSTFTVRLPRTEPGSRPLGPASSDTAQGADSQVPVSPHSADSQPAAVR